MISTIDSYRWLQREEDSQNLKHIAEKLESVNDYAQYKNEAGKMGEELQSGLSSNHPKRSFSESYVQVSTQKNHTEELQQWKKK